MSDLRIDKVETRILDVPLFRPHGFATYTATAQPILLVTVSLEGGVTGFGEGVVPGLSLIHISEPTRLRQLSRMPSSA